MTSGGHIDAMARRADSDELASGADAPFECGDAAADSSRAPILRDQPVQDIVADDSPSTTTPYGVSGVN